MSYQVFTWTPDFGGQEDTTPAVTQVKFGDGYEQRFASGLNSLATAWSLSFQNRYGPEAQAIIAFLRARGGVEAFQWTNPNGFLKTYVCRKWTKQFVKANLFSITASFEEVFEP